MPLEGVAPWYKWRWVDKHGAQSEWSEPDIYSDETYENWLSDLWSSHERYKMSDSYLEVRWQ